MYFLRLKPMDLCLCSLVEVGGLEAWISDGSCDDINNNALCQFDGGDCCGANVRKQHCMDCQCLGNTILGTFSYFYIYTFSSRNLVQDFFWYSLWISFDQKLQPPFFRFQMLNNGRLQLEGNLWWIWNMSMHCKLGLESGLFR